MTFYRMRWTEYTFLDPPSKRFFNSRRFEVKPVYRYTAFCSAECATESPLTVVYRIIQYSILLQEYQCSPRLANALVSGAGKIVSVRWRYVNEITIAMNGYWKASLPISMCSGTKWSQSVRRLLHRNGDDFKLLYSSNEWKNAIIFLWHCPFTTSLFGLRWRG